MTSDAPIHVSGHCYCGAMTFEVDLPAGEAPVFAAYCHCDSCRRSHAAALYQVVCVSEHRLRITAGADQLVAFTKPGARVSRTFCGACGTRIFNRFLQWQPEGKPAIVFFPNTLDATDQAALPEVMRPTKQFHRDECVLDEAVLSELWQ